MPTATTSAAETTPCAAVSRAASHPLHRCLPEAMKPSRPQQQDEDHEREHRRGRRTLLSVGSTPLMTPVAKPIAKPPRVAVHSRSIPPTTTPTRTTIVSRGEVRAYERVLHGEDHRDGRGDEPGEQDRESDHSFSVDSQQACRAEVRRRGAHVQADGRPGQERRGSARASAVTITARIVILRTSRLPISIGWLKDAIESRSPRSCRRGCRRAARCLQHEGDRERGHEHLPRATRLGAGGRRRGPSPSTVRPLRRSRRRYSQPPARTP